MSEKTATELADILAGYRIGTITLADQKQAADLLRKYERRGELLKEVAEFEPTERYSALRGETGFICVFCGKQRDKETEIIDHTPDCLISKIRQELEG
jgi:hypothetical protein